MQLRFSLQNNLLGTLAISEPVGWDNCSLSLVRNTRWHSLSFEYSNNKLRFYQKSYNFITTAYENEGIDSVVVILVEIFDNETFTWQTIYEGLLRMKDLEIVRKKGNKYCECGLEQNDFAVKFKNKEEIKVGDFAINNINLHSQIIPKIDKVESVEGANQYIVESYGPDYFVLSPILFATIEDAGIINPLDNPNEKNALDDSFQHFFNLKAATKYKLKVKTQASCYYFKYSDPTVAKFVVKTAQTISTTINLLSNTTFPVLADSDPARRNIIFNVDLELEFTTTNEEKLFIYFLLENYQAGQSRVFWTFALTDFIEITEMSVAPASTADLHFVDDVFKKLVETNSEVPNSYYSEFFGRTANGYSGNGPGARTVLANGFEIRKLLPNPLRLTFKETFDALNAIFNLGIGIENVAGTKRIRIEKKEYFYKNGVSLHIPNVNNLRTTVADAYYFNQIKVGYEKYENDGLNGLDDFLSKREYANSVKSIKSSLEITSKFIASGYAIETTRRTPISTKEWKYDNDTFVICVNNMFTAAEKNENFQNLTDLVQGITAYNLRIAPNRNLLRWRNWISPSTLKNADKTLKFTAGDGNYKAKSSMINTTYDASYFGGNPLQENQNIVLNNGDALFVPEYYDFEAPLSWQELLEIKENPTLCISFDQGEGTPTLKGSPIDITLDTQKGKAKFKLLRK